MNYAKIKKANVNTDTHYHRLTSNDSFIFCFVGYAASIVMGIDRMFWDSNSWALDRTNSSILLLVCTVLIGGEELIRRHGDERSDGRCLRRRVLNGRRVGNIVMVLGESHDGRTTGGCDAIMRYAIDDV